MTSEEVLFSITGNRQFNNTNVDDISAVVREHPYFSPAQFILALKQKKDNSYNYQYQLQKASLYFSNQVWLNYILNEKEVATPDLHFQEIEPILEPIKPIIEENIFPTSILGTQAYIPHVGVDLQEDLYHTNDELPQEETSFDYNSLFSNDNNDIHVPTLEAVKQLLGNSSTGADAKSDTPLFPSILKEPIATAVSSGASRIPAFSFQPQEEITPTESTSIYVSKPFQPIIEAKEDVEEKTEEVSPHEKHTLTQVHSEVEEPISTISSYSFKGFADETHPNTTDSNLTDAVSISEAYAQQHTDEHEEENEEEEGGSYENNISSLISTQVEGFKKPVEENSKFEFENEGHLHTVDYFASQGIKIDLTQQPQDKLTMQMRRFTDWLKQIKKTDANPQDLGTDPELEKAIQNIAKTSIEAKEIVTETMADVFIKQGKVSKAIQLYIKLSFLDPAKSTYFASKIQQLKGI